jgi:hypothetical protein
MSKVKGAGDTGMRENPKVTSKFDRMHGEPRKPGTVTHPGGVAPVSGSKKSGFTEHGHMLPKDVSPAKGEHKVTHHDPKSMGHGERVAEKSNYLMTDSIRSEKGTDSP